jgi:hypothetical protein
MEFPRELLNQLGIVLEFIVAGIAALTVAFWIAMVVWVFAISGCGRATSSPGFSPRCWRW